MLRFTDTVCCVFSQNESFVTVKERVQKKLDVSDQEFEKVIVIVLLVPSF